MIPLDEHEKESRAVGIELRDCLLFCAAALALALLTIFCAAALALALLTILIL